MNTAGRQDLRVQPGPSPLLVNRKHADISIDIADVWDAFYWCNALSCTFEELQSAVNDTGGSIAAVRKSLKQSNASLRQRL